MGKANSWEGERPEPMFMVVDDGTLDTVVKCMGCGEEYRFNYDAHWEGTYEQFVEWVMLVAKEEHDCPENGHGA